MNAVDADRAEIGLFVNGMFVHADEGTFASLRTFTHNAADPPVDITGVKLNGAGLAPLVQIAFGKASRAAKHPKPVVFAPPVCTLNNAHRAREEDLANGLGLTVEIDADARGGLALLRGLIGPPTVIVASGGEWTDPASGEVQPKLHGHWRLSEPTRAPEDHAKLKRARRLATALVGGDHTNIPVVHPIRWPGSVHRKGEPKLARIVELDEKAEIDLGAALEALEVAAAARGIFLASTTTGGAGEQRDTAALIAEIISARAYVAPLTALSARYAGGGMTKAKIVETLQGLMLAVSPEIRDGGQPGRWSSRFDGIERMAASAAAEFGPDGKARGQRQTEAPEPEQPEASGGTRRDGRSTGSAPGDPAGGWLSACRARAEPSASWAGPATCTSAARCWCGWRRSPIRASGGIRRAADAMVITPFDRATMRVQAHARRSASSGSTSAREEFVPVNCPGDLADAMLASAGHWPNIPALLGIVEAPTLRPDGSVLDQPGYDAASGLYFDDGGLTFPPVPFMPSRAEAAARRSTSLKRAVRRLPVQDGRRSQRRPGERR